MVQYAELEISLERRGADSFAVEWRLARPESDADSSGVSEGHHLAIDELPQLLGNSSDALAYGRRLSEGLFGIPPLKEAFAAAKAVADDVPLRFRLSLSPKDVDLQGLHWETLSDPDAPEPGAPLFMGERILFSRFIESRDWRSAPRRAKASLRALVVVANPKDVDRWAPGGRQLAPVDVASEVKRARDGLVGNHGRNPRGERPGDAEQTRRALGYGPDILYLVCHGAVIDGQPQLWLEDDEGNVAVTPGTELVTRLRDLRQPPRLVVLVSCQSAGAGAGDAWTPSVHDWAKPGCLPCWRCMAMSPCRPSTRSCRVFFRELQKDGQIDRAVARARGEVRDRHDAWAPVLYMRLKSGSLWYPSRASPVMNADGHTRGGRALINHIASGNCTPDPRPGHD